MRMLSLCSGIEGIGLASEWAGIETEVEVDNVGNLITTIESEFKFFRQPHKIGDITKINNKEYLIIGIQKIKIYAYQLNVWYSAQDLTQTDYISKRKAFRSSGVRRLSLQLKHDDHRLRNIWLGSIHYFQNAAYSIQEYTDISIVGTDIKISFACRTLHPVDRKEAKAKLINERRKKLQLEVF
ncbi:DNA cytosine methyltransferase [Brevibacillus laterosporus]|uniref:DNA cytosine methyltransferase n=1 Tax=Brevibacillus laterosporus TaxID=1465 RepID=UPI003D263085